MWNAHAVWNAHACVECAVGGMRMRARGRRPRVHLCIAESDCEIRPSVEDCSYPKPHSRLALNATVGRTRKETPPTLPSAACCHAATVGVPLWLFVAFF